MNKLYYILVILSISIVDLSCVDRLDSPIYNATPFKDSYSITLEQGAITEDGKDDISILLYKKYLRSAFYIRTNNARIFSIPSTYIGQCIVWQYNSDYKIISKDLLHKELSLQNDCKYIRFHIRASNSPNIAYIRLSGGSQPPSEEKRVQLEIPYDRIIYNVNDSVYTTAILMLPPNYDISGEPIPLIIWDSGDGSFVDWYTYTGGSNKGRKNGLNYLRDQGFAVLEIYCWGSYYYEKYPDCGYRSAMPIPTHLASHEKGVEYVLSRYNIDSNNIFHISKSGSGKIALYYAMYKPSFNLKSIYTFAPVFDDLNFPAWSNKGYRSALYEDLELSGSKSEIKDFLEGTSYEYDINYIRDNNLDITPIKVWQMHLPLGKSFIEKNANKFKYISVDWMNIDELSIHEKISYSHKFSEEFWQGYNRYYDLSTNQFSFKWDDISLPETRNQTYNRHTLVREGCNIPFTVIMSPTDEQTPYWNALEVINQFRNAGEDAQMITLESGGHMGPDASTNGANFCKNLTTRLGVSYSGVSIGWYIVVEDIYNRFINN